LDSALSPECGETARLLLLIRNQRAIRSECEAFAFALTKVGAMVLFSIRLSIALFLTLVTLASTPAARAAEVNLYSTREAGLLQPLLTSFTETTGIKVNTVFMSTGLAERVAAEGASSPADLLMVVDIGNLVDLVKRGVTQPIRSAALDDAIPASLRDPDGNWVALSLRARAIFVSKERVNDPAITYEALADPHWHGKVCTRSGQHPYNTALFAAMLAKHGEPAATEYLTALKGNLARRPAGGDRDVARDLLAGICDVGLSNTYYAGLMLSGAGGPDQKRWGEAVRVVLPTFKDGTGTHVNISGAAIARHAPNRAEALKLVEFLATPDAQRIYANANFEYPVRPGVPLDPIVAGFGPLKIDPTPLATVAAKREEASLLVDRVGFDR
jgi:iron(III) transport system substrate-binding protein